jgi:putative SOS response-associated peptidase YedK
LTTLYRCRTALGEVREQFGALTPPWASWSAEMWPGRIGLAVYGDGGERRAEAMRWGIPRTIIDGVPGHRPVTTTIWFQRIPPAQLARFEAAHRCLILLDSFACPEGPAGEKTRAWFGVEDRPVFAWAGIWAQTPDGKAFCGLLAVANAIVPGPSMPVILDPDDYDLWLRGTRHRATPLANRPYSEARMYREALGEPWGGGEAP